jgi:hypothetical protein
MENTRITEERLRTFLNANQPARERMCLALLGLEPKFSELKPGRPMGGPDGGRDIEGLWNGEKFYAGIGFRNNVCDSPEDISWAKNKFKSDLASAKKNKPDLKQFLFITNIDLTNTVRNELISYAYNLGFTNIDIYYRERLRVLLDNNPAGYVIRLQYLEIPLSEEEQISFFNQFGTDIQKVISKKFELMEERLNRVEFLAENKKQLNCLYLIIQLNSNFTYEELGDVFFIMNIFDIRIKDGTGNPGISICLNTCCGATANDGKNEIKLIGIRNSAYIEPNKEKIVDSLRVGNILDYKSAMIMDAPAVSINRPNEYLNKLDSLIKIYRKGYFSSISDLENCLIYFSASPSLVSKISAIILVADEYLIFSLPIEQCIIQDDPNIDEINKDILEKNSITSFKRILHPLLGRLSFSNYTPKKI